MPVGEVIEAKTFSFGTYPGVYSNGAPWQTIIGAGGPATNDGAVDGTAPTNPDTITATRYPIERSNYLGQYLRLRLKRDAGLTGITNPSVIVFGRFDENDTWQILRNQAGAITGTLTTAATDVTDGDFTWTTPHTENNTWDVDGCNELLVLVVTKLQGSGDTSNSTIEGKIV